VGKETEMMENFCSKVGSKKRTSLEEETDTIFVAVRSPVASEVAKRVVIKIEKMMVRVKSFLFHPTRKTAPSHFPERVRFVGTLLLSITAPFPRTPPTSDFKFGMSVIIIMVT